LSKFVAEPQAPNEFEMDPILNEKFERWKPFMVMLIRRYVADKVGAQKVIGTDRCRLLRITVSVRSRITSLFLAELPDSRGLWRSPGDVHAIYKDWHNWLEMKLIR
jgi:hypothetical protein